jgi:nucleoside-diphosphate-sugar epimerase
VTDEDRDGRRARAVVLGCGYVGTELGRRLAAAGHEVTGVRRSADGAAAIEAAGLDAVRADVTDPESLSAVPDADWLVFAASSGGDARAVYVEGLRTAIERFGDRESPPDRLVYTSSTGVYGDHGGDWVDEETPLRPETDRERTLADAERVARERAADVGIDGTVVRLSGLYGPGRYRLERYLDGPVTEGVLNMVHRDDAAGAVAHLLREDLARESVVLVTDDEPVEKWAFADWLADQCGVDRPPRRTVEEYLAERGDAASARARASKRCSNARLRSLGYDMAYPTYREGYREAIDAYGRADPP